MSYGLCIKNNYAYVTTNTSLFILDIQNPEKLTKVSELVIGSPIFGLSVLNNYAFLAASDKGLVIADILNPSDPNVIGEYDSGGTMADVEVDNNYCYTMTYENGIESRRAHWLRTSPRFLRATSDEVAELVNSVFRCLRRGASNSGFKNI